MIYQKGFTLLELLLTISILIIFAAFMVPGNNLFFQKTQRQVNSAELLRILHFARTQAIVQNTTITLCKSADRKTCSGNWQDGIIVFKNPEKDRVVHDPESLLIAIHEFSFAGVLHWRASLAHDYLQFSPSGMTSSENGTFWYCEKNAPHPSWVIKINQAGRARLLTAIETDVLSSLACV
jgi:type IV fimbrial biogenesis protein FimT